MPRLHRPIVALTAIFILIGVYHSFSDSDLSPSTESSWTSYRDAISNRAGGSESLSNGRRTALGNGYGLFGKQDKFQGSRHDGDGQANGPEGVEIDKRGLTVYDGTSRLDRHPIEALIARGKRLAAAQRAKWDEVESLDDSVDDYTAAFGMAPPKGYELWYAFANSISPPSNRLPSLMPLVHEPIVPMLSHDGATLRARVVDMRETGSGVWTFTFVPPGTGDKGLACETDQDWHPGNWHDRGKGSLMVRGDAAWSWRCNNTLELFLPMLPLMPPELFTQDPPFEMAFTLNDGPRSVVHDTFKERSEKLGRAGKTWPKAQLYKAEQDMRWTHGWQWMCPEGSPLKVANTDMVLNDLDNIDRRAGAEGQKALGVQSNHPKSFIADTDAAADFCNNPDMLPYHNMLLVDNFISPNPFTPCIGQCRTARSADIVGVPLDAVWEQVEFVPWSGKTINKAFWRGSTTGLFHKKGLPWRQSQRERLHSFAQNATSTPVAVLIDRTSQGEGKGVVVEEYPLNELNAKWLDAGVSGEPVQCDEEDGTCDEMAREIKFLGRVRKDAAGSYKYLLDIDGNGWSSRFRRLLLGNNVVLKSTLYPEWFSDMLIPWYHYVPLKLDYTDLHDIMAFFLGAPDGSSPGRDDLAEEIAKNGLDFVQSRWRNHDMQSYMYLLTLEFWRMVQDDRKAFSYVST